MVPFLVVKGLIREPNTPQKGESGPTLDLRYTASVYMVTSLNYGPFLECPKEEGPPDSKDPKSGHVREVTI